MKAQIPEVSVGTTTVQRADVSQVNIGPARIAQLLLGNLHLQSSTGTASLCGLDLAVTLDFELCVKLDYGFGSHTWGDCWGKGDDPPIDLGGFTLKVHSDKLAFAGVANLAFDVADLVVNDVYATVGPIQNLGLSSLSIENIEAHTLVMPTAGFQLLGMGFGGMKAESITMPDASVGEVEVGRITGGALPIPSLVVPQLQFPPFEIPSLACQGLSLSTKTTSTPLAQVSVGMLSLILNVDWSAKLTAQEVQVDNLEAAMSIGSITLNEVMLPYDILGLKLSGVDIQELTIPELEVG